MLERVDRRITRDRGVDHPRVQRVAILDCRDQDINTADASPWTSRFEEEMPFIEPTKVVNMPSS